MFEWLSAKLKSIGQFFIGKGEWVDSKGKEVGSGASWKIVAIAFVVGIVVGVTIR